MSAPIGLVLAGGVGRRLGLTKGDLQVGGRPMALRAAETLAPLCASVLISVRDRTSDPAPGYTAIADADPPGRGPLAGIAAAFVATERSDLLVLACDYPRVETELYERMLSAAGDDDELVLVKGHPLVALWRRALEVRIGEALQSQRYRVGALVGVVRSRELGPDAFPGIDLDDALLNLNRPQDLDRLDRLD